MVTKYDIIVTKQKQVEAIIHGGNTCFSLCVLGVLYFLVGNLQLFVLPKVLIRPVLARLTYRSICISKTKHGKL